MGVGFDARGGGFLFHDACVGIDARSVRAVRAPLCVHLSSSKKSTVAASQAMRAATVLLKGS
ncbi:hypothetical protein F7R13_08390 [Burkholderia territorii]|uniref:Uncharacterized protein n=1 Tax=Burkholderia territorii TaxID=1503055 RepID=A0A6L3NJA9_9BURK|nr:hypothetical protein F7R13_08390 [Burkholderia territorii]